MRAQEDLGESGPLQDEPEGGTVEPPPQREDPVESGALEDEDEHA